MLMDRAIFDMNLSIEATSLYILVCALLDQGELPTLERIRVQWNGTEDSLAAAVEESISVGVLAGDIPPGPNKPLQVNPREKWQKR